MKAFSVELNDIKTHDKSKTNPKNSTQTTLPSMVKQNLLLKKGSKYLNGDIEEGWNCNILKNNPRHIQGVLQLVSILQHPLQNAYDVQNIDINI